MYIGIWKKNQILHSNMSSIMTLTQRKRHGKVKPVCISEYKISTGVKNWEIEENLGFPFDLRDIYFESQGQG